MIFIRPNHVVPVPHHSIVPIKKQIYIPTKPLGSRQLSTIPPQLPAHLKPIPHDEQHRQGGTKQQVIQSAMIHVQPMGMSPKIVGGSFFTLICLIAGAILLNQKDTENPKEANIDEIIEKDDAELFKSYLHQHGVNEALQPLLLKACSSGKKNILQAFLDYARTPKKELIGDSALDELCQATWQDLLRQACMGKQLSIIQLFQENGVKLTIRTLYDAAEFGDKQIYDYVANEVKLVNSSALALTRKDKLTSQIGQLLQRATKGGNDQIIHSILDLARLYQFDVIEIANQSRILQAAIESRHPSWVQYWLKTGVETELQEGEYSPIYLAVLSGNQEISEMVWNHMKAASQLTPSVKFSALLAAQKTNHPHLTAWLLKNKADSQLKHAERVKILEESVRQESLENISLLVEAHFQQNLTAAEILRLYQISSQNPKLMKGGLTVLSDILQLDPWVSDPNGNTIYHYLLASQSEFTASLVRHLQNEQEGHQKWHMANKDGQTPSKLLTPSQENTLDMFPIYN